MITGTNGTTLDAKVVGIFVIGASGGEISGNHVDGTDTGIGIYDDVTTGISVHDNTVTHVDTTDPFAAGVDFEPNPARDAASSVDGTANADILMGTAGGDTLSGLGGDDLIVGGAGADTLSGGGGNDVFIIASPTEHSASESIDGGDDTDVIRFTSSHAGDTLTLSSHVTAIEAIQISDETGDATGVVALNIDASATTTDFSITGNAGDNVLTGGAGNNSLDGGAGNDILTGGAGNDTLTGGTNDAVDAIHGTGGDTADYSAVTANLTITLVNGAAASVNDGQGGTDTLAGIENLTGGAGNDILTGDGNANILIGGAGTDTLTGGGGNDRLVGGAGADNLSGGQGADVFVFEHLSDGGVAGAAGADLISGFSITENDAFAFTSTFFTGIANTAGLNDGGHVSAGHFMIANVGDDAAHSYGGSSGLPTFVLDDSSPGFAATLWFDGDGDGVLNGAHDVRIADISNASIVAGFNQDHLLLL